MKKLFTRLLSIFFFVAFAGCLCSFVLALKTKKMADDLWKQLGLSQSDANINIQVSLTSDYLQYAGAKNARNIITGNRVTVVNELVAYAKKFTGSAEFKKMYEFERNKHKPAAPDQFHVNVDSIRAAEKQKIMDAIEQTKANANSTNPKIRNAVPYRLETLNKELTQLDDPNNKTIQLKVSQLEGFNNSVTTSYASQLEKFNIDYPENPQLLIKKRLQEILDITSDVDYHAETKQVGKYNYFVNNDYEKKPKEWKLAFRAGKAATDAVRAAAQKWLQELK
ncbi:MAG: hypothetical protein ACJ75B_09615 [Flavisolibacter sp.]